MERQREREIKQKTKEQVSSAQCPTCRFGAKREVLRRSMLLDVSHGSLHMGRFFGVPSKTNWKGVCHLEKTWVAPKDTHVCPSSERAQLIEDMRRVTQRRGRGCGFGKECLRRWVPQGQTFFVQGKLPKWKRTATYW